MALDRNAVRWRVWAPKAKRVDLVLIGNRSERRAVAMTAEGNGYFHHDEPDVPEGQLYAYRLDGGDDRPDPCSLSQPRNLPGPSAVVRPHRFSWTDQRWRGVERGDLVFYELHVGTFTPQGTFDAIIPRLRQLRELGVTAIELMPVNQFPGGRNWGYDGVLPYAAQNTYGGPQGLARLVDAAHAEGLAVFLDVVYNHFGPEHNYLGQFGPYFADKYKTPWGAAVNYDDRGCDGVRDFVLDNVRTWLDEFHLDGLRLDAVHAIYDLGARHLLASIRDVADEVSDGTGRLIHIVAESDLNDPRVVRPQEVGGHGLDAQWADDFHHSVHALLTGERRGYYSEFGAAEQLARVMATPFLFAWEHSPHRGRKHGAPPDGVSADRFVVCIQNHDQVGNRAVGDRLSTLLTSWPQRRLAASLMLLSPYLPLLFMGEEYAEERPFPFFCSFCGAELVQAVREGRKREFADFLSAGETVPLPDATETFESAKLSWSWPEGTPRAGQRRLYRDLLAARRQWPAMRDVERRAARLLPDVDGQVLELIRGGTRAAVPGTVLAYFNLSDGPRRLRELPDSARRVLFSSESHRYGGARASLPDRSAAGVELLPFEVVVLGPPDYQELIG